MSLKKNLYNILNSDKIQRIVNNMLKIYTLKNKIRSISLYSSKIQNFVRILLLDIQS